MASRLISSGRYAGIQKMIFGLKPQSHRPLKMKEVLRDHRITIRSRTTKVPILAALTDLEGRVDNHTKETIQLWLSGYSRLSYSSFRRQRGEVLPAASVSPVRKVPSQVLKGCILCAEDLTFDQYPDDKLTPSCTHDSEVCSGCLSRSVDTQIPDAQWDQIKCPTCSELLSFDTVKKYAFPAEFERLYSSFFHFMLSPADFAPDMTGSRSLHLLLVSPISPCGDEQPIMTCTACHFKTCFTHKMPWHAEQTCAQYDEETGKERAAQEAATQEFLAKETKKCPNPECSKPTKKEGGCDHIICKQCKHQYCWLCLASWSKIMSQGNSAHGENCNHHTDNIRAELMWPAVYQDDEENSDND